MRWFSLLFYTPYYRYWASRKINRIQLKWTLWNIKRIHLWAKMSLIDLMHSSYHCLPDRNICYLWADLVALGNFVSCKTVLSARLRYLCNTKCYNNQKELLIWLIMSRVSTDTSTHSLRIYTVYFRSQVKLYVLLHTLRYMNNNFSKCMSYFINSLVSIPKKQIEIDDQSKILSKMSTAWLSNQWTITFWQ